MSRSADYTIQGFLYQFNKTLSLILQAGDDATISIEGIVEDIDVARPDGIDAVQCKYHEGQEKFQLSTVYKPVLLMMKHYAGNPSSNVRYRLFAYFPDKQVGAVESLTTTQIATILKSKDKTLHTCYAELPEWVALPPFWGEPTLRSVT